MKTIITTLIIFSCTLFITMEAASQEKKQNNRSIFVFGSTDVKITESDKGFYKEYEISLTDTEESEVSPEKFVIYNMETIYFVQRFEKAFKAFTEQDDFRVTGLTGKEPELIEAEANKIYMMFRLYEANQSFSPEPVAGQLIIEGEVPVQKLSHQIDNTIRFLTEENFKELRKSNKVKLENIKVDLSTSATGKPEFVKDTRDFYRKKEVESSLTGQFRKGRYVETGDINVKKRDSVEDNKDSIKVISLDGVDIYKNRNDVQNRIEDLLITDLITKDKKKLEDTSLAIQLQMKQVDQFKHQLKKTDYKIEKSESELKLLAEILNSIDEFSSQLLSYEAKKQLTIQLVSFGITKTRYQEFIDFSASKDKGDIVPYFLQLRNLTNDLEAKQLNLRVKSDKLAEEIADLNKKVGAVFTEADRSQLLRKEQARAKTEAQIEEITSLVDDLDKCFEAKKNFLVNLEKSGRNYSQIKPRKDILTDSLMVLREQKRKKDSLLADSKEKLDKMCEGYFALAGKQIVQMFRIENIEIEFNEGKIENLIVVGSVVAKTPNCREKVLKKLKFNNVIPYGFTSKKELEQLNKRWIYTDGTDGEFYKMNVGKLFSEYIEKLEVDRRDYSPRNQVISLSTSDKEYNAADTSFRVTLRKEYTHEILGGTVFTDLAGISGDEPNGIVQTEIYKELPLITDRIMFGVKTRKAVNDFSLGIKRKYLRANMGLLAYMRPLFVLSKIENQNKVLPLSSKTVTQNGQTDSIYYASTLDLRRHEMFRVGFDMNVILFDFPELKSTLFVDYGLYWGRVKVGENPPETEKKEYGVDVFEHGPRIVWEVFTDERYGFRLAFNYNWYYARTNDFVQVGDPDTYSRTTAVEDESYKTHRYWNTEFLAFLKPNRDGRGKFFFRYRLNVKAKYWNQTWSQVQLGYAFSITKTTAPKINE